MSREQCCGEKKKNYFLNVKIWIIPQCCNSKYVGANHSEVAVCGLFSPTYIPSKCSHVSPHQ